MTLEKLKRCYAGSIGSIDQHSYKNPPSKGGIFLLVSGLLLITPGFFTDCFGFAMFLKPVQDFVSKQASNYFRSRTR